MDDKEIKTTILKVLTLSGTPYQRGMAHGEEMREKIAVHMAFKIALITWTVSQSEEEFREAQKMAVSLNIERQSR